jgi:methionyl-tRNA synthetase
MKKLLVTSALPYANGSIHLGHLVEYIQTDVWVRYWRLCGRDVIYLCADDTHGTPIMIKARTEGITPEQLIERIGKEHTRDFTAFQIQFDNYYTTHSEENRILSERIFEALKRKGHIAARSIEQAYCPVDKMFLPDRFIRGKCPRCGAEDQYGDACEVCSSTYTPRELIDPYCVTCGTTPVWRESVHLFFRLADFAERLQQWMRGGAVQEEVANKLREWFDKGLEDWDISRDAPYFGFEIPGYPGKYFYVWLDAPIGYMASTWDWCKRHGGDFDAFWKGDTTEVVHFIGKDIMYFHALFWPAMLMGSDHRAPTRLCVHGFLTVNGEKMSKTRGTFINAATYLRHLDPQYLRYYYATKLNARVQDLDLNLEDFQSRVTADLVNNLANIPSRMKILQTNCGGRLGRLDDAGRALVAAVRGRCDEVARLYEAREFGQVTRHLTEMGTLINTYLQEQKPWQTVKEDVARAQTACTAALNACKIVFTLLQPILPEFGARLARMLQLPALTWAGLDDVLEDRVILPYERLVERPEKSKIDAVVSESRETLGGAADVQPPALTLDPLVDCELQTMHVLDVKAHEKADKLVVLQLEGATGQRTVVAGLGRDAVQRGPAGKDVMVLANLEPKTLQGTPSQGMLLAAEVDKVPVPAQVPDGQAKAVVE